MPGGESQQPGGWNRAVLRLAGLPAEIDPLENAGVRFPHQMEGGPGGRQIQVEIPGIASIEPCLATRTPNASAATTILEG